MGKPGAKKNDQIVSVTPGDVHIIMVPSPGGPVPTPIPHPCASMIKDGLADKVKVMGQPGAVKGSTSKHTPPHVPMGPGPFQKPPQNKGEIVTGSSSVFYQGKEAAMLGDTGKMCADPSDAPVGKVIGTAATVLVGGGSSGGDAERAQASAQAMKAAAAACHKWISANMPPGAAREQAHRDLCTATGHPIDVATGKLFTRAIDLELPGRIPVRFIRNYSSARAEDGPLGWGWRHAYQMDLVVEADFVAYRDANGRFLPLPVVGVGGSAANQTGGITLRRTAEAYWIEDATGLSREFALAAGSPTWVPLTALQDAHGNRVEFTYTQRRLTTIRDSAGRRIRIDHDDRGRINRLRLENPGTHGIEDVYSYGYDDAGDLVWARDALQQALTYGYENHLLVRETDLIGFSFYFRFDREGWCRETWGDGGVLYRSIDYDPGRRCTRVVNSEGHVTLYHWNESGLVETEIDALGHAWSFQYDEHQHKVKSEDPLGNAFLYEYDAAGRLLLRTDPVGNAVAIEYDGNGRRAAFVDGHGSAWPLRYDAAGRLAEMLDPAGNGVQLEWSRQGDLATVVDEIGRRTCYVHDAAGNLVERRQRNGLVVRREYDERGQLLQETDPLGPLLRLEYDPLGRVTAETWRDRGRLAYEHDRHGNVTKVVDAAGAVTTFEYGRFNKVLRRARHGAGAPAAETLQEFDSENRLKAVVYPGGRRAEYSFDGDGRIIAKLCVDGRRLDYTRNAAGFVTAVADAGGPIAEYAHDALGRIVRKDTSDGRTSTFVYDALSRVVAAANEHGEVALVYDHCGRVLGESGPHGAWEKEVDAVGRTTRFSFGDSFFCESRRAELSLTLATKSGWVRMEYDQYARLKVLQCSNGVIERYAYQASRRPLEVTRAGETLAYEFDAAGHVALITSSRGSKLSFERDGFSRLLSATRNGSTPARTTRFTYDVQGNRSRERQGFKFAPGNRLVGTARESLRYDARGRIVERRAPDGSRSEYRFSAEGWLVEVRRDGRLVTFRYDAVGRRIGKSVDGEETRFAWQDSTMIHEWRPGGEERHYTYRPNSHVPLMCHRRHHGGPDWEVFFFHNDHRGCPEVVTDADGQEVWRAEIGPYGEIESQDGSLDQPLGLPGQYRDRETGLVYNYRRYFDPELTIFITPDPLGHVAGDQLYAYSADPITKIDPLGLSDKDYDATKVTPHRIVTINGVKYVEFDAADGFSSKSPDATGKMSGDVKDINVNHGGSGSGPDGSPDTWASIGPNGEVVVFEGRHRGIVSAVDDPIPESRGGIPGKPGHLRYEVSDTPCDPDDIGPRLSDLAADPDKLDAARSGHPSRRTT